MARAYYEPGDQAISVTNSHLHAWIETPVYRAAIYVVAITPDGLCWQLRTQIGREYFSYSEAVFLTEQYAERTGIDFVAWIVDGQRCRSKEDYTIEAMRWMEE